MTTVIEKHSNNFYPLHLGAGKHIEQTYDFSSDQLVLWQPRQSKWLWYSFPATKERQKILP